MIAYENKTPGHPARDFDSEIALYYYRARYYNPTVGRFVSEDSVKFAQGVNFYRYTEDDPVQFADPYGHGLWDCIKCLFDLGRGDSCLNSGQACKQKLDQKYPNQADLCAATNSPGADDAYFKVCFQSNPACHNLIENCGKCGLWPPEMGDPHFHQ